MVWTNKKQDIIYKGCVRLDKEFSLTSIILLTFDILNKDTPEMAKSVLILLYLDQKRLKILWWRGIKGFFIESSIVMIDWLLTLQNFQELPKLA